MARCHIPLPAHLSISNVSSSPHTLSSQTHRASSSLTPKSAFQSTRAVDKISLPPPRMPCSSSSPSSSSAPVSRHSTPPSPPTSPISPPPPVHYGADSACLCRFWIEDAIRDAIRDPSDFRPPEEATSQYYIDRPSCRRCLRMYWERIIMELCTVERLTACNPGRRNVFRIGNVLVKSSHLSRRSRAEQKWEQFEEQDLNEAAAYGHARLSMDEAGIRVPAIYFVGRANFEHISNIPILVREYIPGQSTEDFLDQLSEEHVDCLKDQTYALIQLMHNLGPDSCGMPHYANPRLRRFQPSDPLETSSLFSTVKCLQHTSPVEGRCDRCCGRYFAHNNLTTTNILIGKDNTTGLPVIVGLINWFHAGFFRQSNVAATHELFRAPNAVNLNVLRYVDHGIWPGLNPTTQDDWCLRRNQESWRDIYRIVPTSALLYSCHVGLPHDRDTANLIVSELLCSDRTERVTTSYMSWWLNGQPNRIEDLRNRGYVRTSLPANRARPMATTIWHPDPAVAASSIPITASYMSHLAMLRGIARAQPHAVDVEQPGTNMQLRDSKRWRLLGRCWEMAGQDLVWPHLIPGDA